MYEAELKLAREAYAAYRAVVSETHTKEITHVKGRGDFATETDEAVETAVSRVLAASGLPIQGEEYSCEEVAPTRWVIDPIDGTFNYAVGIPVHGFTVCYVENNEPVVGIVEACGEVTEAVKGRGTTLNGTFVRTSLAPLRESAVMSGDITTDEQPLYSNRLRLANLAALSGVVAKFRVVGSAAADLSWVATGRAAGAVLYSNHPWDMASGVLAVREAGGIAHDLEGNEWSLDSTSVLVAANADVAAELFNLVKAR